MLSTSCLVRPTLFFILSLFLAAGCAKRKSTLPSDEGPNNLESPFGGGDDINDALAGPNLGDASGLTDADRSAIANLTGEFDDVEPIDDGTAAITQALVEKMAEVLREEQRGKDVAMQKMALMGQMMQECAKRVGELAPRPEQPLLGGWVGNSCMRKNGKPPKMVAAHKFDLSSAADRGPGKGADMEEKSVVTISGGMTGKLTAKAGGGSVDALPWTGSLSDSGLDGRASGGMLFNPKYKKVRCDMPVKLVESHNPIPENYIEAMRKAGKCFRQALFVTSPIMDDLFKNMDPQIANVLKSQMLGIK